MVIQIKSNVMKKIIWICTFALLAVSCTKEYEFSALFMVPTQLSSPGAVVIDISSSENIILSWTGGGATQGYVTYEVLFDKVGGDFSEPVYRSLSDLGVESQLTLTHALLNTIARKTGIPSATEGKLIWTVVASKGGDVKFSDITEQISVTRSAGVDYTGNTLYLFGTATENSGAGGLPMRNSAEGVFIIYTKASIDGDFFFKSSLTDENVFTCYAGVDKKIVEGDGKYEITANAADEAYRITVDLNAQTMVVDKIGKVEAIWGATYDVIGDLVYQGNGIFKAEGCPIKFIQTDRPDTNPPSWLGWIEERYYFIANVNGADLCWGRNDNVSAERPLGNESSTFYELHEFSWNQWDHLWKMKGALDLTKCTITINTNDNGLMTHSFSNVQPL